MNIVELNVLTKDKTKVKLDLSQREDAAPRIFKRQADPTAIEKASVGDYTLSLKLPKTSNNLKLFGFANRTDKDIGFLDTQQYECEIVVNSYQLIKGILEVDSFDEKEIKATIIGENIRWKNVFKDKSLRDIDSFSKIKYSGAFGSDVNNWAADSGDDTLISFAEVWTSDENTASFRGNHFDCQFPFILRGNGGWPDPTVSGFTGFDQQNPLALISKPVYQSKGFDETAILLRNTDRPIDLYDCLPAPYLKTTIRKIFESENYSVTGSFMEDVSTDNILIPFVGDAEQLQDAFNWGILGRHKSKGIRQQQLFFQTISPDVWYDSITYEGWGMYSPPVAPQLQDTGNRWSEVLRDNAFNYSYTPVKFEGVNVGVGVLNADQFNYRNYVNVANNSFTDFNAYVCPTYGTYNVKGSISVTNEVGIDGKVRLIFVDDYEPAQKPDYINDSSLTITNTTPVVYDSGVINVSDGTFENISFDFDYEYIGERSAYIKPLLYVSQEVNTGAPPNYILVEFDTFEVTPFSFDDELNPAKFLPDLSITEFLSSLAKTFNLVYTVNGDVISIDYKKDTLITKGESLNWDDKCNIEQGSIKRAGNLRNVIFKGERVENKGVDYEQSFTYQSPYQNVNETQTIKTIFAPAGERNVYWLGSQVNTFSSLNFAAVIPIVQLNENEAYEAQMSDVYEGLSEIPYDYPSTLLKWSGVTSLDSTATGVELFVGDQAYLTGAIPQFGYNIYNLNAFNNLTFPITRAFNLNWQDLFNKYYSDTLDTLQKTITVELPVYLTPQDVAQFNVKQPVVIQGVKYMVLSIEGYNPAKRITTKVKLLRL